MASEQQLERSMLDGKDREELHAIAGAMGVKGITRLRKADLVDAILAAAAGRAGGAGNGAKGGTKARERRGRREAEASRPVEEGLRARRGRFRASPRWPPRKRRSPVADAEPEVAPRPARRTAAAVTTETAEAAETTMPRPTRRRPPRRTPAR